MTSTRDMPDHAADDLSANPGSPRPRGRRAAMLLAAAAPLAAALATAPAAVALATTTPAAAHGQAHAAALLGTAALPVTTARTGGGGDPKIPEAVGD